MKCTCSHSHVIAATKSPWLRLVYFSKRRKKKEKVGVVFAIRGNGIALANSMEQQAHRGDISVKL